MSHFHLITGSPQATVSSHYFGQMNVDVRINIQIDVSMWIYTYMLKYLFRKVDCSNATETSGSKLSIIQILHLLMPN